MAETADAYWQPPTQIAEAVFDVDNVVLRQIDGELWALVERLNGSAVYRSKDGGETWTAVNVAPPPADGALPLRDIARQPGGRYLISGTFESRCSSSYEVAPGLREAQLCTHHSTVMFVSDDGDSWRRVDPPAMAPPGDASVVVDGIAASAGRFLAVDTVKSDDWYARLWSSPDGESWTLERELRDGDLAISARDVLTDGDEIVVLAAVHPCAMPWSGSPVGWVLGTASISHVRIFEGATPAGVELRGPGDHPLAVEPAEVDCSDDLVTLKGVPYPRILGAMVGGDITLVRTPAEHEQYGEDVDPRTGRIESHRLARLVDGAWQETELPAFEAVAVDSDTPVLRWIVDVDGQPGFVFLRPPARVPVVQELFPLLPEGDGTWAPVAVGHPLIATLVGGVVWTADGLLAVGGARLDPYDQTAGAGMELADVEAWPLVAVADGATGACDLVAAGRCQFADLSLVDGYPNFEGRDLTGIDLAFANLGDANLDGANLAGARMWNVAGRDASFVGANFAGAALHRAELGDATGANLAASDLTEASLRWADQATIEGANLDRARLGFATRPDIPATGWPGVTVTWRPDDDHAEPYELSLAGIDLTGMTISGDIAIGDDPVLRITNLTGATLASTTFNHVDLSAIDPTTVDLTDVTVWDNSICPDGDPPDGGTLGTCVRER